MRSVQLAVYCVIFMCLQGCSTWLPTSRYGPDPVLNPEDVAVKTDDQVEVLRELAAAYGEPLPPQGTEGYYSLTLAGFNYIDEVCDAYIEELFKLNRRKNRLRDILTLTASSSAAVLNAANAGKDAMLYVATALGFTSSVIGITADSYLYREGPTKVHRIVRVLQSGYREDLAKKKARIRSAPIVIYELRSYLSLCFPVTIESKFEEAFANLEAKPDPNGNVTTQLTLSTPPAKPAAAANTKSAAATPKAKPAAKPATP